MRDEGRGFVPLDFFAFAIKNFLLIEMRGLTFAFFPLAALAAKRFFLIEMRGEALVVFSLGGRRKIAGSRERYEAAKSNS